MGAGAGAAGPPWSEIAEVVRTALAGTTITEIAQREAQEAGASMYYI